MTDTSHQTLELPRPVPDLAVAAADLLAGRIPPDDAIVLLDHLVSGEDGAGPPGEESEPDDCLVWHAPWVVIQVWPNRWAVRSAAFSRILGHAPDIAQRHGPLALVHPADRGAALRAYAEITTGRRDRCAVPLRVGAADGGLRLLETTFVGSGRPGGARSVVVYAQDRTGPHADHVRLREVISRLDHGVMVVDGSGCVRLVNGVLTRMFGAPARDWAGRHEEEVLRRLVAACRDVPSAGRRIAALLSAPGAGNVRLHLADGRLVDLDRTPVADTAAPLGAIWQFRDVPVDRGPTRTQREAPSRQRSVLGEQARALTVVSRDLAAIARLAGLLSSGTRRTRQKDWRIAAGAIARDTRRTLMAVDDLATLSGLDSGMLALRYGQIHVPELVTSVVAEWRAEAEAAGVTVVCRADPGPFLPGDSNRLRQVLGHLVGNAVKFSVRGGTVTVSAQAHGRHWLFVIADRGMGIPAADLGRVTRGFARGANAVAKGIPGHGLGLAICCRLVELHRGELTVESVVDVGTTVRVAIPVGGRGR